MFYRDDPRWIKARYPSTCRECGTSIARHADAFWYPRTGRMYCADCGAPASRQFDADAFDEAQYQPQYTGGN